MEEEMELIERYLYQVGKHLPVKNREDILAEIRSHLEDTLEERTNGKPGEEDVVELLKEMGSPRKIAASYNPQNQYLIGPALYPLFRMVAGIALAASIGAQLLAGGISLWVGSSIDAGEFVAGLLTSVPTALGSVVIVFMILQAAGVQPKMDEAWDPRTLPAVENKEEVKRGELIFGISAGIVLLALLIVMPERIGIYNMPGAAFYANPVILQYLPWIYASLALGIGFDIYMLWQGRWNIANRALELGTDVFSIVVLTMLYKGHVAWLEAHGASGVIFNLLDLPKNLINNPQVFGMQSFCMAFGVALIVLVAVSISKLVKMILRALSGGEVISPR